MPPREHRVHRPPPPRSRIGALVYKREAAGFTEVKSAAGSKGLAGRRAFRRAALP